MRVFFVGLRLGLGPDPRFLRAILQVVVHKFSGDLQPIDMDPGSVIPVPDQVRDDRSGTEVTSC
jgi:hypothetical protein